MKTRFQNNEICHAFIHGPSDYGRSNSMSYSNNRLLSYGTEIAYLDRENGIVWINDTSYSNTTCKHQNELRSAIPHNLKKMVISGRRFGYSFEYSHESRMIEYINYLSDLFDGNYKEAIKPRKIKITGHLNAIDEIRSEASIYYSIKGASELVSRIVDFKNSEEYSELLAKVERLKAREEERERLKQTERMAEIERLKPEIDEALYQWFTFEHSDLNLMRKIKNINGYDYLRINGGIVETSQGLSYELNRFNGVNSIDDIKGGVIGFHVTINGDVKIGCHKFERSHIESIIKEVRK